MYTREQIIEEIKRIAAKMGVVSLTQEEFEFNSMIPMSTVRYYLGNWKQALLEAGLGAVSAPEPLSKCPPENEDQLLVDLLRLNQETGEIPTPALIEAKGKFYLRFYLERWKSIGEAYLLAQKKFSSRPSPVKMAAESYPGAPLIEPAEIFFQKKEDSMLPETINEALAPHADIPIEALDILDVHEFIEKPFSFRGLTQPPVNKSGVIFIFGLIHGELGYSVSQFLAGQPDAQGERCVDRLNKRWEPIHIYFEYKSSDVQFEVRTTGVKEILVCWDHDWRSCPVEVLELRSVLQQLPSR